jgi:hypothetical protein
VDLCALVNARTKINKVPSYVRLGPIIRQEPDTNLSLFAITHLLELDFSSNVFPNSEGSLKCVTLVFISNPRARRGIRGTVKEVVVQYSFIEPLFLRVPNETKTIGDMGASNLRTPTLGMEQN